MKPMRNIIQLKKATQVELGEHILVPQFSTGIILASKVSSVEVIDAGECVEIATLNSEGKKKRLFIVGAEDVVAVVI